MVEKYRNKEKDYDMIRQKLRLFGRFLLSIKQMNDEITDMSSVYDPKYIDDALKAINKVARFNEETASYRAPTVAFSVGTLLKQLGEFLIVESIKSHDDTRRKNTKNFLKLLSQELNININRNVAESHAKIIRRKRVDLPLTDDIKKLHIFLNHKRNNSSESLQKNFSLEAWMALSQSTLLLIQIFNRRRAGEVERIFIEDFHSYQGIDEKSDKDLFESLDRRCKLITKRYVRFLIRGKLNRTVPVLLDLKLVESIETILKFRQKAGVVNSNPYLFGLPGNDQEFRYLRACKLMRQFSEECGAQHPERLRGTKLRKHIATTCIRLNLEDQDVLDLANFMGHAEKIHKTIYRQPLISREIINMSRLLEVAQGQEVSEDSESESEIQHEVKPRLDRVVRKSRTPGNVKRTRWSEIEKEAVKKEFSHHLKRMSLPSFKEVQYAIKKNPNLRKRTPPQIRIWIHNQTKKDKGSSFSEEI